MNPARRLILNIRLLLAFFTIAAMAFVFAGVAVAQQKSSPDVEQLPTGASITSTAAPGSRLDILKPGFHGHPDRAAGDAVSIATSPDGKTMLILTSGYNLWNNDSGHEDKAASTEWIFVFDISGAAAAQKQALQVPNSFSGIVWNPNGNEFYVAGGMNDSLHTYAAENGKWRESGKPILLGHAHGLGINIRPMAAGVGITQDGSRCVIADFENDAVTIVDLASRRVAGELDLRPGKNDPAQSGKAGGEFPYWVAVRGNDRAYISSVRDREVVVVDLSPKPVIAARIGVHGQPNKMALNRAQTLLYVSEDNSDTLAVIDTANNKILGELGVTAPADLLGKLNGFSGSSPNSILLSRDERTAYLTLGGANAVAVVALDGQGRPSEVTGLIPTAWYPTSATLDPSEKTLYVSNGKSNPSGPNAGNCRDTASSDRDALEKCHAQNKYILQLMRAGLLSIPLPGAADLRALTDRVITNNRWHEIAASNAAANSMSGLRGKDSSCDLHHQGKPHLRSGAWRSRKRKWRSGALYVARAAFAEPSSDRAAIRDAR